MKLYDKTIAQLKTYFTAYSFDTSLSASDKEEERLHPRIFKYNKDLVSEENRDFELILKGECAFCLGGEKCEGQGITLITEDRSLFGSCQDETILYGRDLGELFEKVKAKENSEQRDGLHKPKSFNYARIAMILTKPFPEEETFKNISDMDYVKYHVYPKGFMIRSSSLFAKEEVRVGKVAIEGGLNFEKIGNIFINHYKTIPNVLCVKMIFVTASNFDYLQLKEISQKCAQIKESVIKIKEGMPTECASCGIRDICNDIEGLKELHFGKKKPKQKPKRLLWKAIR